MAVAQAKKAVIIKTFDDGTSSRPYGHALVIGISKYPRKVTRKQSNRLQTKKTRIKAFIRTFNFKHLMPTRYSLGVEELKSNITNNTTNNLVKRTAMRKE